MQSDKAEAIESEDNIPTCEIEEVTDARTHFKLYKTERGRKILCKSIKTRKEIDRSVYQLICLTRDIVNEASDTVKEARNIVKEDSIIRKKYLHSLSLLLISQIGLLIYGSIAIQYSAPKLSLILIVSILINIAITISDIGAAHLSRRN